MHIRHNFTSTSEVLLGMWWNLTSWRLLNFKTKSNYWEIINNCGQIAFKLQNDMDRRTQLGLKDNGRRDNDSDSLGMLKWEDNICICATIWQPIFMLMRWTVRSNVSVWVNARTDIAILYKPIQNFTPKTLHCFVWFGRKMLRLLHVL